MSSRRERVVFCIRTLPCASPLGELIYMRDIQNRVLDCYVVLYRFRGDRRVCMLNEWELSKDEGVNASADVGTL